MEVHVSVDVDLPVEEAFAYWADLERHPEWADSVLERRKLTDGPLRVGTQIHGVDRVLGRKVESSIEVTAFEPNRLMSAAWSEPTPGRLETRFEATDAGTHVDFTVEANPTGVKALITPLFKGLATGRTQQYLTAYKQSAESQDS